MKEPAATAERQQARQRGLVASVVTLPWRLFGVLIASLLLSIVIECVGLPDFLGRAIRHVGQFGQVISLGFCTAPDAIVPAIAARKAVTMRFPVGYTLSDFEHVARDMDKGHADPKMLISSEIDLLDLPAMFDALRGPNRETKVHVRLGREDG